MVDIFRIIGAIGLIFISMGVLRRRRAYQDESYIIGGICLEIYSLHVGDILFMVLQIIFTLAAIDDFIKNKFLKKHSFKTFN